MEEEIIETKTVDDFLNSPSADNFIALGESRDELILREAKVDYFSFKLPQFSWRTFQKGGSIDVNIFIPILMKVSSLAVSSKENVSKLALDCSEKLFKELFTWSENSNNSSVVNNTILVHLGLIKVYNYEGVKLRMKTYFFFISE
jgi:hypothetical protein